MISLKLLLFLRTSCFLMLHPKIVWMVPPDYCFHQLNRSDCEAKPTPVFYYYKPGSRCERAIWRGCPTFNIFENEYECSNTCIYRFTYSNEDIVMSETQDINWEEEIKKIPSYDAIKLHHILTKIVPDTVDSTPTDIESTDVSQTTPALIETTVADTTETTSDDGTTSTTTTEKVKKLHNPEVTTSTTTTVLTTVSTSSTTESTTKEVTTLPTTVTSAKRGPEEVDILED